MFLFTLFQCTFVIFCYMSLLFIIALIKHDNSIADIGWGIGFIIIALITFFKYGSYSSRQTLITLLTIIWGLRLSIHIFLKNWGKEEDIRYQQLREKWQEEDKEVLNSFLYVFMLQGLCMLIIAYPIILVNTSHHNCLNLWDITGLLLWLGGFFFESVGDYQLHTFLKKPENTGKIMKYGLWKYTRHPNYFGEIIMWWGIFFIAFSVSWGATAIISPITVTILLLFVSGIPMNEKLFDNNPDYQEYKKNTSVLIPWFF